MLKRQLVFVLQYKRRLLVKSLLFINRGQDTEVTFIRGGHRPGSQTPNSSASPAHNSPRGNSENGFPSAQNFHLNLSGLDNSSSPASSSRSSRASEPDLSNTDVFMKELLVEGLNQSARSDSRESSLSVETFQGSPQSQVSPPALSDSQPAVMQPTSHPIQPVGGVRNHSVMPNSHPQLVNGFYPAPSAVPQRLFGSFQPAMSSTPTTVDNVPNGFPGNVQQAPWNSSPPYVNGVLGSQPQLNQTSIPVSGNGKFLLIILIFAITSCKCIQFLILTL